MKGRLLLIPSALSEHQPIGFLPAKSLEEVYALKNFIAERSKTARHFLKAIKVPSAMSELSVLEMNKHSDENYTELLQPCLDGLDVGLLSEAGAPGVADPGSGVVLAAHRKGIKVVPLVGPSSLLLALMASGMNGQQFAFHGYLPKDNRDLVTKLKDLESDSKRTNTTHLFIETPFRNIRMFEALTQISNPDTLVSIAVEITSEQENIRTLSIKEWKKTKIKLDKKPAVFLLYAGRNVK
ncbi:SAM-dependent methyltransferase [Salibacteraceae bacterium]|jgi:16S rRNA (cytidine1402-2'-O)-methyltransferase|nr:SAM-dependent methyltransferase [Salibacteraceae bacterium]